MSKERDGLIAMLSFAIRAAANQGPIDDETGDDIAIMILDHLDRYLDSRMGHPYRELTPEQKELISQVTHRVMSKEKT